MPELKYTIAVDVSGRTVSGEKKKAADAYRCLEGTAEVGPTAGAVHVRRQLPQGIIGAIRAELTLKLERYERIFMNGYQSWTWCPEYTRLDYVRGLGHLPRAIVRKYSLDRYGDYHFVNYPQRRGITHGFSYCYFRQGDHYQLIASLDERPGYTEFRYDAIRGIMTIERDAKGIACCGAYNCFDLFFMEGTETEVFDAWFRELGLQPRTRTPVAGYCSWYNRYENIREEDILLDLSGCAGVMKKGDLFQVDDGWEPCVGDWLDPDEKKFSHGMLRLVQRIHRAGYQAGLWLAPFVCGVHSALAKEHPDWLLRPLEDDKPWLCGCNWGGFWSLDLDNPEVVDYLRQVFSKVFDDWGFDMVKLDFLYAAAPFGSETETRAARMYRAMDLLRKLCGDHPILACGVPLMPAFGKVEYCRIGCDVSLDWDDHGFMKLLHRERPSTKHSLENTIFRRQLNGRAFLNDPDVFFLRDDNLKLTTDQKRALCEINSVLGSVLLTSDDMSCYNDDQREKYEGMLANRHAVQVSVDAENGLKVAWKTGDRYDSARMR